MPVVVLTGHATIDLAVRAVKEGADQFLAKPVELRRCWCSSQRLVREPREKRRQNAGRTRLAREAVDPFTGTSAAIRALAEQARKLAASSSPVLIEGETGSGKGVLARWLHRNGPRADEPFVDMNCAGLSREFLETELFGHEKGAYTGAVSQQAGAPRGGAPRGDVPRRDRRPRPAGPAEAAEGPRGEALPPAGRGARPPGRRAARRRLAPEPAPARAGEEVPRRPVLPHQHDPPPGAVAAREARRTSRSSRARSWRASRATSAGAACGSPPRPSAPCAATPGPAT